jgi:hypothetical protein
MPFVVNAGVAIHYEIEGDDIRLELGMRRHRLA